MAAHVDEFLLAQFLLPVRLFAGRGPARVEVDLGSRVELALKLMIIADELTKRGIARLLRSRRRTRSNSFFSRQVNLPALLAGLLAHLCHALSSGLTQTGRHCNSTA